MHLVGAKRYWLEKAIITQGARSAKENKPISSPAIILYLHPSDYPL
jgi:hypothetical protein